MTISAQRAAAVKNNLVVNTQYDIDTNPALCEYLLDLFFKNRCKEQ